MQADEELLILEGVDMFGLGNWAAVAEHVGTKDAHDCQQHYNSVYINSPAFPEPMPLASMANINQLQVCFCTYQAVTCNFSQSWVQWVMVKHGCFLISTYILRFTRAACCSIL